MGEVIYLSRLQIAAIFGLLEETGCSTMSVEDTNIENTLCARFGETRFLIDIHGRLFELIS